MIQPSISGSAAKGDDAPPVPPLSKLCHDLRSPLSAILGFAALLEDNDLPAEERGDYVAAVRRAAEQMLATIDTVQNAANTKPAPAQPRVQVPQLLTGCLVLLADDEPRLRQLTQFCLEKGGANVVAVRDGQEALELATTQPFDVILLDMEMPVMDGYEATRELRKRGIATPIVAFTAHASPAEWERCREAGCTRQVTKPFEAESLVRELAAAIDESRKKTA
jgi:CheY-like chemotaxis protein